MFPHSSQHREQEGICRLNSPGHGGRNETAIRFFSHLAWLVIWLVDSKPIRADNYQCLQSGLPYRIFAVRFPSDWLWYSSLKPNQQSVRTKWRKWNNGAWEEVRSCVTHEYGDSAGCRACGARQMSTLSYIFCSHWVCNVFYGFIYRIIQNWNDTRSHWITRWMIFIVLCVSSEPLCSVQVHLKTAPPFR